MEEIESTESIEGSSLSEDLNRFWLHVTGEEPNEEILDAFEKNRPKEES